VDTLWCLLYYCRLKFRIHKNNTSLYIYFDRLNILSGSENVKNMEKVVAYVP
jgi:hypothetical protein